jgi:hypothetical protein
MNMGASPYIVLKPAARADAAARAQSPPDLVLQFLTDFVLS